MVANPPHTNFESLEDRKKDLEASVPRQALRLPTGLADGFGRKGALSLPRTHGSKFTPKVGSPAAPLGALGRFARNHPSALRICFCKLPASGSYQAVSRPVNTTLRIPSQIYHRAVHNSQKSRECAYCPLPGAAPTPATNAAGPGVRFRQRQMQAVVRLAPDTPKMFATIPTGSPRAMK